MKISWITFASLRTENGAITSDMASARYRMLLPGRYLQSQGHKVEFHGIGPEVNWDSYPRGSLDAEVVIFSKSFNPANEQAASFARRNGAKVLFDISDNHFIHPEFSAHYRTMAALADRVTVPTAAMGKVVLQHTGLIAAVIPDPVEGQRKAPSAMRTVGRRVGLFASTREAARLLWFGHPSNLPALLAVIPSLRALAQQYPIELEIVTSRNPGLEDLLSTHAATASKNFRILFSEWSLRALEDAMERCDLVIVPGDPEGRRESVKSHNRLTEALWAGKYVVAHPLPAYQDFIDWAWISEDLVTGIKWALTHPDMVPNQVAQAQVFINDHLTPEHMGARWLELIAETGSGTTHKQVTADADPLRLNLGCGDKILPGHLNIDVALARAGKVPDIICDLHALPFDGDMADEILSVHVIEHFWRWEVQDVLREWVRVLKPGGRMILECPNLLAACQEILRNPNAATGEGRECQRSMWVLYGDPTWRDPLMVHRWAYTPESLAEIMRQAGLINVRQEPAQFKLREPRDMRVVGIKPHRS
ncbi:MULTISPECIES: methyltransferase domain-containing protein [Methylococcus]|uniref:Methyltransferase domain-containing protein n=1 Tax=Methylococcus capsulatus TaxID=414 RepID=A0ABZ2F2P1_METCP|nr:MULTISPECIES: methyltransferase domain-containing protein [Methylococcus]MDF9391552.1 methyltransferase domain-containing protein [Methylococcus capsulatus]